MTEHKTMQYKNYSIKNLNDNSSWNMNMRDITNLLFNNFSQNENIKFGSENESFYHQINNSYINKSAIDSENQKNKVEKKKSASIKIQEIKLDKTGIYYFKLSEDGNSWSIGADNEEHANAFKNGASDCPPDLTIPTSLTDTNGNTKPVEIIDQFAFFGCGYKGYGGMTKKLTLSKQVKVIKKYGLGCMYDLEEFAIQEGSVLETMEYFSLQLMGAGLEQIESKRITLILPSTLSTVFQNGIYRCNLFNVIIYCGSHPLANSTQLEEDVSNTVVKVSSQYPSDKRILGKSPVVDSKLVGNECKKFNPMPDISIDCLHSRKPFTLALFFSILLFDSDGEKWIFDLKGTSRDKTKMALEFWRVEVRNIPSLYSRVNKEQSG